MKRLANPHRPGLRGKVALLLVLIALAVGSLVAVLNRPAEAFGGEDLLSGDPWYHPAFTYLAATQEGFTLDAAATLAWHADYIDSYAYNPLFWLEPLVVSLVGDSAGARDFLGFTDRKIEVNAPADPCNITSPPQGWTPAALVAYLAGDLDCLNRLTSSLAVQPDLVKLHFDDLLDTEDVAGTWDRLFGGTIAGLLWAAENDDVAAAQTLLGVSLHAVQDFYAHSSWMDEPSRRNDTWINLQPADRLLQFVRTGSYERPEDAYPHGKPSLSCSGFSGSDVLQGLLDQATCPPGDSSCQAALTAGSAFLDGVEVGLDVLNEFCTNQYSPFSSSSLCTQVRGCEGARQGSMTVLGLQIPAYYNPPGVALDNRAISLMGAQERGLMDASGAWLAGMGGNLMTGGQCNAWLRSVWAAYDGYNSLAFDNESIGMPPRCNATTDRLFAVTTQLAKDSSRQWLQILEEVMVDTAGLGDFWNRVKTESTLGAGNTDQYEVYSAFPFQFLTAGTQSIDPGTGRCVPGPHPECPVLGGNTGFSSPAEDQYYLRVTLRTGSALWSGTDADIYLDAAGKHFLLDYMPTTGVSPELLVAHNDFERGDVESFMVGPFSQLPATLALRNDVPDVDQYLTALWSDIKNNMLSFVALIMRGLGLDGPDYVAGSTAPFDGAFLGSLAVGQTGTTHFYVSGGGEGKYRLYFDVTKTAHDDALGTSTYSVRIKSLYCVDESTYNMATNSDEPFVLVLLQGDQHRYLPSPYGWFNDVDRGETKTVNYTFPEPVTIRDDQPLSLMFQIWESDEETSTHRRKMFEEFLGLAQPEVPGVIELLGMEIGSDWRVASLKVEAFSRSSETVRYGVVYDSALGGSPFPRWIDGDSSAVVNLAGAEALRAVDVSGRLFSPPVTCRGRAVTNTNWTEGDDVIRGTPGADVLFGGGGNDIIDGLGGNDIICGGKGDDTLMGGSGNDRLSGDAGADLFLSDQGTDTINGGPGVDTVSYAKAVAGVVVDLVSGLVTGGDDDTVIAVENVIGSPFADTIRGSSLANFFRGMNGNDSLLGRSGNDRLIGGLGSDHANGGAGVDECSAESRLACE